MDDGLHVDDGYRGVRGERADHPVLAIRAPVLERREGTQRNQVAVAREYAGHLGNVLFGIAVHHGARLEFDAPGVLARLQHDGYPAELLHAQFE